MQTLERACAMFNNFKDEFTFKYIGRDLPASIAVFLVAVPLCLGIAHASQTPLLSGLIAGIVGGIVVGILSKSPLSVSGPAAGLTAIVSAAAIELGDFSNLLVAVFLAGLFQIALGIMRAGVLGSYIPNAVIRGMLSAIGIILILKQLPHLMGYDAEDEGNESFIVHGTELHEVAEKAAESEGGHAGVTTTFTLLWDAFQNIVPHIFAIGIFSIVLIVVWEKTLGKKIKVVPGSLLAVVCGTLLSVAYTAFQPDLALSASHLVQLPSITSFADFTEKSAFPNWSALSNPRIYVIGLTIALVAAIESLLSVEAVDKLDPHKRHTPTNRELIAQGAGNTISGLIGGIPMTSVIVRSSTNVVSGGHTKMSAIMHGVWLLIAVVFAASIINLIPLAALAAVLIMVGLKLAGPAQFKSMYRAGQDQFIPYVVTIVAIVLTDLLIGVLIGLAVASVFILYSHYKSDVIEMKEKDGTLYLHFSENVTFLNKARILDILDAIEPNSSVVLDTSECKYIDHDVLEVVQEFKDTCHERGIRVLGAGGSKGKLPLNQRHAERLDQLVTETGSLAK